MRRLPIIVAAVIVACACTVATSISIAASPNHVGPVTVTGTITVNNPATAPVLVRKVDDPAKSAFGYTTLILFGTSPVVGVTMPIPTGKRLVIETVSIDSVVAQSSLQKISALVTGCLLGSDPSTPDPSTCQNVWVNGSYIGRLFYGSGAMGHFAGTTQARGYADTAQIVIYRDDTTGDNDNCTVSVSGYLVDLP